MSNEISTFIGALAGLVTIILGLNALYKWIKSHNYDFKAWFRDIRTPKRKDRLTIIPFPRHGRKK